MFVFWQLHLHHAGMCFDCLSTSAVIGPFKKMLLISQDAMTATVRSVQETGQSAQSVMTGTCSKQTLPVGWLVLLEQAVRPQQLFHAKVPVPMPLLLWPGGTMLLNHMVNLQPVGMPTV